MREPVTTEGRSYDIIIGPGRHAQAGDLLHELKVKTTSRHLIVTDEHVRQAGHLDRVTASLEAAGYTASVLVIPAGEESKSLERAALAYDHAYRAGLDRKSVVLALGGGVVGDFAGFVAGTYMRGIDFVQLPTTLLAHDSAVGGKVAVNLPYAKNIVGVFHQPLAVLYDTDALRTLPAREVRSGLAEAIKHGIIRDEPLFRWIDEHMDKILAIDDQVMSELLARSCRIKAQVVSEDERELGVRAILNYGHTIGHAVEILSDHDACRHGEGVAIGMAAATELSALLGYCGPEAVEEVERVLKRAGLPTRIPNQLKTDDLIATLRQDKKATGGTLTFVLMRRFGEVEINHDVPEDAVRAIIEKRRELS